MMRSKSIPINFLLCLLLLLLFNGFCFASPEEKPPSTDQIHTTMKKATRFMVEKVSYGGGYVWFYLPDFSRRWGELEAYKTMVWIQPPGTATMGHLFLDAYHATSDDYYYQAAEQVAAAIIRAQHSSGGWNYMADFGGKASLRKWYNTIGKNAWRLEEFHQYTDNATFDDGGTAEAAKFLLRLYIEKRDKKYRPALDKAIHFVLDSQYPIGGWPQRYPHVESRLDKNSLSEQADYASFITFNDDVARENIDFLLMCYQGLKEPRLREPIIRAMNAFLVTQLGQPQPGWALQYTRELQPAAARSYEPRSLSPATTAENIRQLIKFYRITGETKFLARIPEALDWLDKVQLSPEVMIEGRTHPSFVEIGSGKTLYTHRRGSNATNGEYYVDKKAGNELAHYRSTRFIDLSGLRKLFMETILLDPEEVIRDSPLINKMNSELPRYFTLDLFKISKMNAQASNASETGSQLQETQQVLTSLNDQGYWPAKLRYTTNPYLGPAPSTLAAGNFASTEVGDKWDTSAYTTQNAVDGISLAVYIKNMGVLIEHLATQKIEQ